MKIEHIAVYVKNLEATKEFYIKFFGASAGEKYHNKKTGFQSYFLSFDDGSRLEIMTNSNLSESRNDIPRTGYVHIAFSVGSVEAVDELTQRLKSNGYRVISEPRITGDGYYESCILDGEENIIEITV